MKRLPKKIQQIIKKKRFTLNSLNMNIKYRISSITTDSAKYFEKSNPWGANLHQDIWVNIKVSGVIETSDRYDSEKSLRPIEEVALFKKTSWNACNSLWGHNYHKRIRHHIRNNVIIVIEDFLKLMGIKVADNRYELRIKTISWE